MWRRGPTFHRLYTLENTWGECEGLGGAVLPADT